VKKARANFPDKIIIAGNVVTGEMVEELFGRGRYYKSRNRFCMYNPCKNRSWISSVICDY
jgi:hypothetical protein